MPNPNKELQNIVKANYKMIKEYHYEKNGIQLNFNLNIKSLADLNAFYDLMIETCFEIKRDIAELQKDKPNQV